MKARIILTLFCFLLTQWGMAQTAQTDSLEQLLATPLPDTARMEVISQLLPYYLLNDLAEGLEQAAALQAIAERADYQSFMCESYAYQGKILGKMNEDIDKAVPLLEQALTCYRSINDSLEIANTLSNIGIIYTRKGFHREAISLFQQHLAISEALNDTALMVRGFINMGAVLKSRLEYAKSLSYSHQGLRYARQINSPLAIGILLNNIAYIHFIQGQNDTALVLFEEALLAHDQAGAESSYAVTLANIGGLHVAEKRFDLAKKSLDEAYARASKVNYPFAIGLSFEYMAKGAMEQQQYVRAVELAHEGLAVFGDEGIADHVQELYGVMSESYEQLGQPDSALAYLKSFQVLNDSLFQAKKEVQIQDLEISFEVKQKEMENALLKSQQYAFQQELKNRNLLTIGLVIALVMVCGWGLSIYGNSVVKKKMNDALESQVKARTQELETSNRQLKQANYELQTFNYIASHDIKEPIRNISSYVGLIQSRLPDEIKDKMGAYFQVISASTSQLYALIEDFSNYTHLSKDAPGSRQKVDVSALVAKIKMDLRTFLQERNGKLLYEGLPEIITSSSLLSVALKNLIENGLKFNTSEIPTVRIRYEETATHHLLHIADNGIGIEPDFHEQIFSMFKRLHSRDEYPGTGMGLALSQLVMEKLDGEVSLQSEVGVGSVFTLNFPK